MNKNALIVGAVIVFVASAAWLKHGYSQPEALKNDRPPDTVATTKPAPLPRLVELGAGKCQSCKLMAPIIDEIKKEYAGRVTVEKIDVMQEPQRALPYNWRLIPLQIFFDAEGNEVGRHEGFLAKEDIVAQLAKMGVK